MGSFYIVSSVYAPNSAPTNRALAFIRGFSELGITAKWVFLIPSLNLDTVSNEFNGIEVRYLWNKRFAKNLLMKHIYKYISLVIFLLSLKKGDTVLLLGMSSYLHAFVNIRGIRVFHERTEHPEVVRAGRYRWMDRLYYRSCLKTSGIFVISHALKDFFSTIGLPDSRIHVINMVVDSNRFNKIVKTEGIENYVAYCGKASNSKDGVDDLIKSFAIVSKRIKDIRLYVIGDPPSNESNNKQLVEQLGLEERIVFTGIVSSEKMPQILKDARVLALARPNSIQNKYGFPTKLGEYLLTGNPVVVTKVGDIPLFLHDSESALMTDCSDIVGFADKICWALEHPSYSSIIGQRGKDVAVRNFNYLIETRKMVEIIFGQSYELL